MLHRFKSAILLMAMVMIIGCDQHGEPLHIDDPIDAEINSAEQPSGPFLVVLGVAQDAGYPQAACHKECCRDAWSDASLGRSPVSLGIVEPAEAGARRWMIECTPEFRDQMRVLDEIAPVEGSAGPDGILLTHAHIGHYAGLIQVGREVMGANAIPVYAMPRMKNFLETNGPWNQLVSLNNIELRTIANETPIELSEAITVTPILVPHRDEYSETVGYVIAGPRRKALFLPDIDKWERWDSAEEGPRRVEDVIAEVDVAYLDGSFFDGDEIPGRDLSEIPHPFIVESLERFAALPDSEQAKIRFIHFNHTNDALREGSAASEAVRAAGFRIAVQGERVEL